MYMLGDDVERSYENAFLNSSKGALLGDGLAQRSLAKMYSEGLGCDKDSTLAVYWIKKAATRHNVFQHHAQYGLGMWYWEGNHVEKDYTMGMSWLLRAAKGRLPDALLMLGMVFEDALGGYKKNPQRAAFFYEESVLEDEVEGMFRLGRLHCRYDSQTEEEDNDDEEKWADFTYGIEMLNQAVNRGHADACELLETTVQGVVANYDSMDAFRNHIASRAVDGDDLCIALRAALDAIAMFQEDNESVGGLTDEQIDDIKSHILRKSRTDERCCICLGDFEKGESVRELDCNHLFHKECVDTWLRQNRRCPLCKQSAVAKVEE